MANINKIRISGTSYDIQDKNAPKVVELTQAQYDALVTKDDNTFYVITDASQVDLSQYWTSAQTNSAITQATSGKVDTSTYNTYTAATDTALSNKQTTLTAGTGIDITDNVISATGGGGGKAIEAGRGITVTTGETADTVSFNLPISAGTGEISIIIGKHDAGRTSTGKGSYSEGFAKTSSGQYSHAEGWNTYATANYAHAEGCYGRAKGEQSHAEGYDTNASGKTSHVEGTGTQTKNESEHASGHYNNSVSASTTFGDSGNTLFSVGNGTSSSARHNAFEIRQNGDIYLSSGGTDIKLQDHLGGGGGGSSYTAGDGIDITNDVISVTGKVDTTTYNAYTATTYTKTEVDTALGGKQTTLTAGTGISIVDNVISATGGGGNANVVELTQAQYDALTTIDPDAIYVITDAQGGDLSQYMTSAQTTSAITQATSDKVSTSAITTSITSSSTDAQVPSAKAVYDIVGDIETLLSQI